MGKGNGTFHTATNYGAGLSPNAVAVADFNRDGKPDLVVANYGDSVSDFGDVSMLLGKGDGTFESAVNYRAGLSPAGMAGRRFRR